jgi:hypothetical protein
MLVIQHQMNYSMPRRRAKKKKKQNETQKKIDDRPADRFQQHHTDDS